MTLNISQTATDTAIVTEIDGPDNDGPSKLRGMTLADLTLTDQIAGVEIDEPHNDGPIESRGGH